MTRDGQDHEAYSQCKLHFHAQVKIVVHQQSPNIFPFSPYFPHRN